ncbi:MAG: glycosyltransferase [Acidobacteriota bacterium]
MVPTHRRPAQLTRCLEALVNLSYPSHLYEVVIVDDGGAEATADLVAAANVPGKANVVLLTVTRGGPAKARNAGARVARGQLLAFTDDDCVPEPDWLTHLDARLHECPDAIVGGHTVNAVVGQHCSIASQLLVDYLYGYYFGRHKGSRFFTTNNLAVTAAGFQGCGGFDESFPLAASEDREFCERWERNGGGLEFAEQALVGHWHRLTLRGFIRQHFNYGRGADFLHRSRNRATGGRRRPKLEPTAFYWNLIWYPFHRKPPVEAACLSCLMFLSQAVYGCGYVYQRVRNAGHSR